jgi:hypothetical protein
LPISKGSLSNIFGGGSFDQVNGEIQWQLFLGSGSHAAAEFSSENENGKSIHAVLVTQTNQTPDSKTPRSKFDETVGRRGIRFWRQENPQSHPR